MGSNFYLRKPSPLIISRRYDLQDVDKWRHRMNSHTKKQGA